MMIMDLVAQSIEMFYFNTFAMKMHDVVYSKDKKCPDPKSI